MSMEPSTFTGNSNGVNHPIDRSQRNRSLGSLSSLRLSSVDKLLKAWHSASLYRDRRSMRMGKNRHLPTKRIGETAWGRDAFLPWPTNFHDGAIADSWAYLRSMSDYTWDIAGTLGGSSAHRRCCRMSKL
jgi:hypothetical protein